MNEIYNPGQAKQIFDVWPSNVEWFVLGGTADANEAQTVHEAYPDVKCVGFEPHPEFIKRQQELQFPGTIYPYALWHQETELTLKVPHTRGSSVCRPLPEECITDSFKVQANTLDYFSETYGPFNNCVLWLDIEHAELAALQGAKRLLDSGSVLLANVEVFSPNLYEPIAEIFKGAGLKMLRRWDNSIGNKWDYVFVKSQ